jgi:xylose isomerase
VADLNTVMDLAAELDAWMVACCPLLDGHNYGFQADYPKQWRCLEQGIAEAGRYWPDLGISQEYKLNESRNYAILGDRGVLCIWVNSWGWPTSA